LIDADLTRAHAPSAKLLGADLTNANFFEADLRNAKLMLAGLSNDDLRSYYNFMGDAQPRNATLKGANFSSANMDGVIGYKQ